jgi:hypothetical protein
MNPLYQQIQGLYTAGDILCAVDCVRALPDYPNVFFVNHDDAFADRVSGILNDLGVMVRRNAIVTEAGAHKHTHTHKGSQKGSDP